MAYEKTKKKILMILAIVMLSISVSACGIGCVTRSARDVDEEVKANCFTCPLFSVTYSAASQLSAQVYSKVLPGAANFLAWGFMIWLTIEIAKYVGSIKAPDAGEFWKKIFFKFLICIICIIIVRSTDNMMWFVNTILNPIFVGFINFASSTMTGASCSLAPVGEVTTTSSSLMPLETRAVLECLIGEIHVQLAFGKSLGRALICHQESSITIVLVGFLFWIAFSVIGVVFPFYVVDCIIRLGLTLSLLPLFIMAFPFESTRKFTNKGFILFLDAGMTLAIISIAMTLVTGVMRYFIQGAFPFIFTSELDDANNVDAFAGPGTGTLVLLFLIVLAFSAVSIASSIAQGLVGSSIPNGVMSTAMKAIKNTIKAATTVAAVVATATGVGAVAGGAIKGASMAAEGAADTASDVAGDGNGN